MQRPGPTSVATALRRRYERAQDLALEGQIRELVDYLENPEVLVAEFVDAYCAIEGCADPDELILESLATRTPRGELRELFTPGRSVELEGSDEPALRCVAGSVPLLGDAGDARQRGLDYVALVPGSIPTPVLGVLDRQPGTTPYILLMRALCCLAEVAPAPHLERVNRELFKGGLLAGTRFDLHLVLRSAPADEAARALGQLTHDLAEGFCQAIADEWQFPDLLRRICCVCAEGGRLRIDWSA